ncbi:unnamed protein product [Heterosigma akashiwo]
MMTWMTTGRTRRRRRRKSQRLPMVRRTGLPLTRRPRRPLQKRQRKTRILLIMKKKPMHREGPEGNVLDLQLSFLAFCRRSRCIEKKGPEGNVLDLQLSFLANVLEKMPVQ